MLILLHRENIFNNDLKIYAPEGTILEQQLYFWEKPATLISSL